MGAVNDIGDAKRPKGCFISVAMGVVLFLLAVCVTISVGLLVYFAHPDYDKHCVEPIPDDIMDGNCPPGDVTLVPDDDIWAACVNISDTRNECIPSDSCSCENNDITIAPPTLPPPDEGPTIDYRLPSVFQPVNYDIHFRPDIYQTNPEDFTFQGTVTMNLLCTSDTNAIYFHTRNITLIESTLEIVDGDSNSYTYITIERNDITEIVTISVLENIAATTNLFVTISYMGPITNDMAGMYYSYYADEATGQMNYMLATQFQSTDARKAFPCLDEPHFRSTYLVSIDRKDPMTSLCNMPIDRSEPAGNDWITDIYLEHIEMPTYLIAWAVSSFNETENIAEGFDPYVPKAMGYWARPDQIDVDATLWAMAICPPMFDFLEDYFEEQYSLTKLDQIAIPQFSAGAMENWGLATYREIRMLVDRRYAKIYDQQRASGTLAHELLHKWIGNLLTCAWWDDIWLNEGFARYFQHLALQYGTRNIDEAENPLYTSPAWPVEHAFISQVLQPVLASDHSGTSPPIIRNVSSPSEISSMFSTYTYDKGGSLLRMFDNFMGDAFQTAQRAYIDAHANQAVVTDDFLEQLDLVDFDEDLEPPGDFGNAFRTWLYQMGFPLVTITRNGPHLTFRQDLFLIDTEKPIREEYPSPYDYLWTIPVSFTDSESNLKEGFPYQWIWNESDLTLTDAIPEAATWYLANIRQVGYYRVNYDDENWEALIQVLLDDSTIIHPINRAALIDDSFKLARSGHIQQLLATRLSEYLSNEQDWIPFDSFNINLPYLEGLYALSPDLTNFEVYVQRLISNNYARLGWDVETDTFNPSNLAEIYLMELTLKLACKYNVGNCREIAVERYAAWRQDPENLEVDTIKPDVRDIVYCYGFRYHDDGSGVSDRDFAMILELYGAQEEERERDRLRDTLACASEPYLLQTYYELAQSGHESIREADRGTIMRLVAEIPDMQGYVWTQLNENWENDLPGRTSTLQAITDRFSSEDELAMFDQFVSDNPADSNDMILTYSDIRFSILANIRWQERNGAEMSQYLADTAAGILHV